LAQSALVEKLSICVKVAGCCRLAKEKAKKVFWKCEDTTNHNNGKLKFCTHAAISAQSYLRGAQVNAERNKNNQKGVVKRGWEG